VEKLRFPFIRSLVLSSWLDLLGASLVLGVCLYRSFHETIYFQGEIQFGIKITELLGYIGQGAFPLGILSIVGAIFSLLSTRLIGKQNNAGNVIGVLTAINSGVIDFMFGNASAIITYPLTFFIMVFSVSKWKGGEKIKPRDFKYYTIIGLGILFGFVLVYLGAYLFGGRTDGLFLNIVAITFGLSIGGNICSALKYEETWLSWVLYNIVQLTKAAMQFNLANVVKYIFYLFNAAITLVDWRSNGDITVEGQMVQPERM